MEEKRDPIEVWGLPTCGTTRKAAKFLESKGIPFEYMNLRETSVPETLIADILNVVDHVRKAFNTSGGAYKAGGWKDKIETLKKEAIVEALTADPMLIKRPVVRTPKGVVVGFDEEAMNSIL